MSIHYSDDTVTLLLGDAAEEAATLEPQSVQTVVTSPPYFGLRDYGMDGQLGAESSPAEFVANLVAVFEAIRPALADDGTLWVNLGDTYAANKRGSDKGWDKSRLSNPARVQKMQFASMREGRVVEHDRPLKNLLLIPFRFALAMQDAGWILRSVNVWNKPNAMPESVADRPSSKHEYVLLFAKRGDGYYYDQDAIRVPLAEASVTRLAQNVEAQAGSARGNGGAKTNGAMKAVGGDGAGANLGDVWTIPTRPFSEAHFATFPPELPEVCILAGSREGDTVLDPFSGSGTTGMVATKHGRRYIGVDLNPDYHELALKTRLAQGVL